MFIDLLNDNGKDYLRLVHSVRQPNRNGVMVSTKKVIFNIGPLDRFDDGDPDYLERLRRSFRAGKPLIDSLIPYCSKEQPREVHKFSIQDGSPDCISHSFLYAHRLIDRILEELGLYYLFSSYKGFEKVRYDVYGFFRLLVYGRVLNPASKVSTVRQNNDYYDPILRGDFKWDNIYDTLDFIDAHKDQIIRRMNTNLVKKAGRSPEVLYYDVTNFFFEIDEEDDDTIDEETGEVITHGLRQNGHSKENRKSPIVQMGLFMDQSGIPIAMEQFPGNNLDHQTLIKALERNIDGIDEYSRFILIADRGVCNYPNLLHVLDAGNGYICAKSLLKSKKEIREWAYSDEGYIKQGERFKYKSKIVRAKVIDEKGAEREIEEMVVVYWSKSYYDRCMAENKSFLEFLEKLQKSPHNFRITALQSKSIRKYLKKKCVNEDTGEILDSSKIRPLLDTQKIEEFKRGMGFYQLVTSEIDMAPREVINKYHGLKEIEERFHTMKGVLNTRPVYVRTPAHINAHLLTCLIALVVVSVIQKRIVENECDEISRKNVQWSFGMTGERIQTALNKWKVNLLPGGLYRFEGTDDEDLKRILTAFHIEPPQKLFRKGELNRLKTSIQIFM